MLTDELTSLLEAIVLELNQELVELQYRREPAGWVLRLIIDNENGVSLDDCANVSREVSRILEVEDIIDHAYRLEVSSPGLDRPLRKEEDFQRFKGRKAKIKVIEAIDNQRVFQGCIEDFQDGSVVLTTEQGKVRLPFKLITKARLVVDF